jgi:hypothetical protein
VDTQLPTAIAVIMYALLYYSLKVASARQLSDFVLVDNPPGFVSQIIGRRRCLARKKLPVKFPGRQTNK